MSSAVIYFAVLGTLMANGNFCH